MLINTPAQQIGTLDLVLTCSLAAWRGGPAERWGAALFAVAWVASPIAELRQSWYQPQYGIFAIDLAVLVSLTVISAAYGRAWAICAAGFQALAVLFHVAFLVNPHALYRAYLQANFAAGFLVLGALMGGVLIEVRPRAIRPAEHAEPV